MPIISLELDAQESLNSALRVAARESRLDDLKRFIAQGGDVNGKSNTGQTALIYASRNCSSKIVRFLLSLRARGGKPRVDVNSRDQIGRTALMYAAAGSCAPVAKLLLDAPGIEIKVADRHGRTLRDYALYGANLEVGGPVSDTYKLIMAAEKRAKARSRAAATRRAKS